MQGRNLSFVLLICPQLYLCCWFPVASSAVMKSTAALKNRGILLDILIELLIARYLRHFVFPY